MQQAPLARDAFAAIAEIVVPRGELISFRPLTGGVSATLHALQIALPGGAPQQVVVRQFSAEDWKPRESGVAAKEFALLTALRYRSLAVPEPLHLDESGELLPGPYLVMELVDGGTEVSEDQLPAALEQMATFLTRLHALPVEDLTDPEPTREDAETQSRSGGQVSTDSPPTDFPGEPATPPVLVLPALDDPVAGCREYLPQDDLGQRVRAALLRRPTFTPRNTEVVVHGDFWPGNVLWHCGKLVAVIDWEDAARGDPLADIACARAELLCRHGETAMHLFTEHYRTVSKLDWSDLPLWETFVSSAALATMAQWRLAPAEEASRRANTRGFLERAAGELLAVVN